MEATKSRSVANAHLGMYHVPKNVFKIMEISDENVVLFQTLVNWIQQQAQQQEKLQMIEQMITIALIYTRLIQAFQLRQKQKQQTENKANHLSSASQLSILSNVRIPILSSKTIILRPSNHLTTKEMQKYNNQIASLHLKQDQDQGIVDGQFQDADEDDEVLLLSKPVATESAQPDPITSEIQQKEQQQETEEQQQKKIQDLKQSTKATSDLLSDLGERQGTVFGGIRYLRLSKPVVSRLLGIANDTQQVLTILNCHEITTVAHIINWALELLVRQPRQLKQSVSTVKPPTKRDHVHDAVAQLCQLLNLTEMVKFQTFMFRILLGVRSKIVASMETIHDFRYIICELGMDEPDAETLQYAWKLCCARHLHQYMQQEEHGKHQIQQRFHQRGLNPNSKNVPSPPILPQSRRQRLMMCAAAIWKCYTTKYKQKSDSPSSKRIKMLQLPDLLQILNRICTFLAWAAIIQDSPNNDNSGGATHEEPMIIISEQEMAAELKRVHRMLLPFMSRSETKSDEDILQNCYQTMYQNVLQNPDERGIPVHVLSFVREVDMPVTSDNITLLCPVTCKRPLYPNIVIAIIPIVTSDILKEIDAMILANSNTSFTRRYNKSASPTRYTDAMELNEWTVSIVSISVIEPSSKLLHFLSACQQSDINILSNVVFPLLNKALNRILQENDSDQSNTQPQSVDAQNGKLIQSDNDKERDLPVAPLIALYYHALESIIHEESVLLNIANIASYVPFAPFHHALLACCYTCLLYAMGSPQENYLQQMFQLFDTSPIEFFQVLKSFNSACSKQRPSIIPKLPDLIQRYLRSIEIKLLETHIWNRQYQQPGSIMFILENNIKNDESKWPIDGLECSLPEETGNHQTSKAVTTTDNSSSTTAPSFDYLLLTCILRKVLHLSYSRIKYICYELQIPSQLVQTQVWIAFRYLLRNHIELFYGRHLDQWILCTIYGVCKMFQINLTFTKIVNIYCQDDNSKQRIVRQVPLTSSLLNNERNNNKNKNNETGTVIDLYNQFFVPKMKQYLLTCQSLKKAIKVDQKRKKEEEEDTTKTLLFFDWKQEYQYLDSNTILTPLQRCCPNNDNKHISESRWFQSFLQFGPVKELPNFDHENDYNATSSNDANDKKK